MKKNLLQIEEAFTVLTLMFYSGAFVSLLSGSIAGSCDLTILEKDTAIVKLIYTITYVVFLGLLVLRWKRVLYLLSQDKFISLLVGLAFISCLWSADFSTTLNRFTALFGTTSFGLYLASRYSLREQIQLLARAFWLGILFSLLFGIAIPSVGTMCSPHEGAWRGIYSHKNSLGKLMVLSVITFLLLLMHSTRFRIQLWLGLSGSFLLLILCTSKSSLVTAITILMLLPVYHSLRLQDKILAPVFLSISILLCGTSVLLLSNAESIFAALGKDPTLTGRTELWAYSLKMIQQRIFLGYGFQSFWQGYASPAAYVWRAVGWEAPNAHNGLIELAIDLGLLGILIFLAGFVTNLVRAFIWVRVSKVSEGLWPLMYLTFLFLINITESSLVQRNNIYWVLYVALTLTILTPPKKESDAEVKESQLSIRATYLTNH